MSLFVLSDTHLALHDSGKSMEVFGARWQNYIARIEKNWRAVVSPEDTVIIAGDVSWAMTLEETQKDFSFLQALPGTKLLGKGNHDFWWNTASKMNRYFAEHDFTSLRILYNNAYVIDQFIVCGTRGWFIDPSLQKTVGTVDYDKIVNRELIRLRMSLDAACTLKTGEHEKNEILPFLHFPPVWGDFRCNEFITLLNEYGIKRCFFGHIHTALGVPSRIQESGIQFILTAADHLDFTPLPIF
ncbi:MAG: metallophosphoesterase [Clostridia bacterium]|nr:metallophosphoesterase [Clostridia bacterium]